MQDAPNKSTNTDTKKKKLKRSKDKKKVQLRALMEHLGLARGSPLSEFKERSKIINKHIHSFLSAASDYADESHTHPKQAGHSAMKHMSAPAPAVYSCALENKALPNHIMPGTPTGVGASHAGVCPAVFGTQTCATGKTDPVNSPNSNRLDLHNLDAPNVGISLQAVHTVHGKLELVDLVNLKTAIKAQTLLTMSIR